VEDQKQPVSSSAKTSATQVLVDYAILKQHAFFNGIDWKNLHQQEAVMPAVGVVSAASIDKNWSRRKNSIMWNKMPDKIDFAAAIATELPPLIEHPSEESTGKRVLR
jgi:hypothetical protein